MNSEFNLRNSKNPSYSIRSYARDLNINSSSLSSIMNGKRKIPKDKIASFAKMICDNDADLQSFVESANADHVNLNKIKKGEVSDKRHLLSEQEFAIVSDVHTYTLLSLLEVDEFAYDTAWISKKLRIDESSVKQTISNLLAVGLIEEKNGTLVRLQQRTTTTDDLTSKYIMKHHLDSLELAKAKYQELTPHERYFSTLTIPSDPAAIGHVKKLIIDFEDKLEAYLNTLDKKEVFKISIQYYQATEK